MRIKKIFVGFIVLGAIMLAAGQSFAVTITFMHFEWRDDVMRLQEDSLRNFENQNPGIKVEINYVPWKDTRMTMLRLLATGDAPGVWECSKHLAELMGFNGLTDLSKYVANSEIEKEWAEFSWHELKLYDPERIYAIPQGLWVEPSFIYNKKLFREAGISPPPTGEAWTWEEALDVAKKLTGPERWGWVNRCGTGASMSKSLPWVLWSNDTDIITQTTEGEWVSNMKDPKVEEALGFFIELVTKDKVCPPEAVAYGTEDMRKGLVADRIGMMPMGSFFWGILLNDHPDLEWDYMMLPYNRKKCAPFDITYFAVPTQTSEEKVEAAFKVIQHLTKPEIMMSLAKLNGNLVPRASLWNDPYFTKDPRLEKWTSYIPYERYRTPASQYMMLIETVSTPVIQRAMLGEISLDEVFEQLDTAISETLER